MLQSQDAMEDRNRIFGWCYSMKQQLGETLEYLLEQWLHHLLLSYYTEHLDYKHVSYEILLQLT